ncbi:MAG: PepSY domain-containing protein [Candidatus Paceibacteria bacterium]
MTNRKIHKISGLIAGVVILILSITGFFLDHYSWKFLHTTTLKNVPSYLYKLNKGSFYVYLINPNDEKHIITGGARGIYESFDAGENFIQTLDEVVYSIKNSDGFLYVATANGIYKKEFKSIKWNKYLLDGKIIKSLNIYKDRLLAVEDKTNVIFVDLNTSQILFDKEVTIPKELLTNDITLSRLVRDIHYGRGLFDGHISLLINDYAAIILIILGFSGFILWWLIYNVKNSKRYKNSIKYFVKLHSNIFSIIAIIPIILLVISGIFLDHGKDLNKFMNEITISNKFLPPVYKTLKSDIFGADFDGKDFYIGNRFGIFKSSDLINFEFVSEGFAYKMIRKGDVLYVSGMGSSNRILDNNSFKVLENAPHMFKDVFLKDGNIEYFSSHNNDVKLPVLDNITLHTLLYSLHDGSFFASWWVWVNDLASILLLVLLITGFIRWYLRSNLRKRIL